MQQPSASTLLLFAMQCRMTAACVDWMHVLEASATISLGAWSAGRFWVSKAGKSLGAHTLVKHMAMARCPAAACAPTSCCVLRLCMRRQLMRRCGCRNSKDCWSAGRGPVRAHVHVHVHVHQSVRTSSCRGPTKNQLGGLEGSPSNIINVMIVTTPML